MIKITCLLFLLSAFPTCNKCFDSDERCIDNFELELIDKNSGNNLIFGPTALYHPDSVYLTTNIPGYRANYSFFVNEKIQSTLLFPVDTFFLRLSAQDSDTLVMRYDYVKNDCCKNDQYGRIADIIYNGIKAEMINEVYLLRK